MKKAIMLALLTVLFLLTACGTKKEETATPATADQPMTVGFIFVGPIGDGGFTYAQNEGRLLLEKETGVKTIYKESVPEGPEVKEIAKKYDRPRCYSNSSNKFWIHGLYRRVS